MQLLHPLFHFLNLCRRESQPRHLALGVLLGMFLGLTPTSSAQWYVWLAAAFVLRSHLPLLVASAVVWGLMNPVLDPFLDRLGERILTGSNWVPALWDQLSRVPLVTYFQFHNTVVAGSLTLLAVLAVPLFLGLRLAFAVTRTPLLQWFQTTVWYEGWQRSRLRRAYVNFNETARK